MQQRTWIIKEACLSNSAGEHGVLPGSAAFVRTSQDTIKKVCRNMSLASGGDAPMCGRKLTTRLFKNEDSCDGEGGSPPLSLAFAKRVRSRKIFSTACIVTEHRPLFSTMRQYSAVGTNLPGPSAKQRECNGTAIFHARREALVRLDLFPPSGVDCVQRPTTRQLAS